MFLSQHLLPQPPLQHSHHLIFSSHESKLVHSQSHLISLKAISVSCHFTALGWHLVWRTPHAWLVATQSLSTVSTAGESYAVPSVPLGNIDPWTLHRTFSAVLEHKREPSLEHTHYIYHKWFSVHLKQMLMLGQRTRRDLSAQLFASFASIYSKVCRCCELSPASFISCASDAVWNVNVGLFK